MGALNRKLFVELRLEKQADYSQTKEKFFTEIHEKFVEPVPQFLKKLLDEKVGRH